MERYLSNPNVDKTVVNPLQVYEGGTSGTTVKEAQENLDILDKGAIGAPNGLAILPPGGLFGGVIEGGVSDTPMIDGPSFVRTNQTNRFFITNYDIETDYVISTTLGRVERDKDYLIFYSGPEVGVATIKVNNLEVKLDVLLAIINMPFILSPTSGTQDINSLVEIQTSMFVTGEVGTHHASTDWQLSTTVEMDNLVKYVEKDQTHLTNWKVEGLKENVTYYVRFRYWDNVGNKSSWSEITQFTTRKTFTPQVPDIVAPSNGTKGLRADVNFTATNFFTYEDATHLHSDWQVSTSSVFAGLVDESKADEVNLTTWSIGGLSTDTMYYVRVRYTDNKGRTSDWSLPSRFTTRASFSADTPTIVSPANQSDNHNSSVTVTASYFANGDSRVTHQSSDWEVSEDNSFQYPFISSYSNSTAKVEWIAKGLQPNTTYFVRVRYRDTMGFVTDWSKAIQFTTRVSFSPARPTITSPANSTTDVGPWLDLRTSAYVSNNVGDSHLNSDWEIGTSLTFNDLVKWNTATVDDKISWRVKGLQEASQYFVRVRHLSIVDGVEYTSDWSPVVNFTTKFSFAPGKPTITYPKSGSKDISENVTITSTNYLPSDSQDVHVNSDWEISTSSAFTDIVLSNYGSAVAKTSWVVTNLRSLTTFFVRVRHRTINDGIYYVSDWSSANNFTVEHEVPSKPVILTPSNGSTRVPMNVTVTSSSFVAGEVEENHYSSSWEISANSGFNPVISSSLNSVVNKVSWNPIGLQATTNYFVRVKHIGSLGFESDWSDTSQFTTKSAAVSSTPSITSPTNGATNVNATTTITSSTYSSSDAADTHMSSDWELATDSNFGTKVKTSTASTVDKTAWNVTGLTANTTYYVRVRHTGSESGPTEWSSANRFTTKPPEVIGQVAKPSITSPANGTTGLNTSFTISSSAFSSSAIGDGHKASDWEVATDIGFSALVKSSYDNTSGKTTWNVGGLSGSTTYYLRVRYKGNIGGNSPWSDAINVRTKVEVSGGVDTPTITNPEQGAVVSTSTLMVTCSAFSSQTVGETHLSSDWEISTNSAFTTVVKSSYDVATEKTAWGVTGLQSNTSYHVRVKHTGSTGAESSWSTPVSFSTSSVQVPGANGVITYPTRGSPFVEPNNTAVMLLEVTPAGSPIYNIKLDRQGNAQKVTAVPGSPIDAFGQPVGDNPLKILGASYNPVDGGYILHWLYYGFYPGYGWGSYQAVTSTDTVIKGLLNPNGNIALDGRFTFTTNHGFSKIAVYRETYSNIEVVKMVTPYTRIVADNGGVTYLKGTPFGPPSGYLPSDFASSLFMNRDGTDLIVLSGSNYLYIYKESGNDWTFAQRVQMPGPAFTIEFSKDGSTFVVGGASSYEVWVYTKTNGTWGSPQTISVGGGSNNSTLKRECYATISEDGTTIAASGANTYSKMYVYRKQGDGSWGEVKVIDNPLPSNSTVVAHSPLANISADGSSVLFQTDGYRVYSPGSVEDYIDFPPVLKLAY